ncbi:MAG: hypothetical protein VX403_02135, partial [Planctomycetota bacterium]|nr:hypothetical protein [Planctomycetota bacterium]
AEVAGLDSADGASTDVDEDGGGGTGKMLSTPARKEIAITRAMIPEAMSGLVQFSPEMSRVRSGWTCTCTEGAVVESEPPSYAEEVP